MNADAVTVRLLSLWNYFGFSLSCMLLNIMLLILAIQTCTSTEKKITCHSLCWVEDHRIWSWWTCPTFNHRVDLTLSSPFEIPGSRQHFSRMCKIRFGTRRFEKLLILLRSVYYFHFNLKAEEARLFAEYSGYRKFPASWKPTQILSSARELVASDLLLRWTTLATWPHLHWSIRYACCTELCFRL